MITHKRLLALCCVVVTMCLSFTMQAQHQYSEYMTSIGRTTKYFTWTRNADSTACLGIPHYSKADHTGNQLQILCGGGVIDSRVGQTAIGELTCVNFGDFHFANRGAYQWDFSSIQAANVRINSVRLEVWYLAQAGVTVHSKKLTSTQFDMDAAPRWAAIGSAQEYEDFVLPSSPYGGLTSARFVYDFPAGNAIYDDIKDAVIGGSYFSLALMADNDETWPANMEQFGAGVFNVKDNPYECEGVKLTVGYSLPVSITVQNSFTGGTVIVDNQTPPKNSPYNPSPAWWEGETHTLTASSQPSGEYYYELEPVNPWTNVTTGAQINQNPATVNITGSAVYRANFKAPAVTTTIDQKLSNNATVDFIGIVENGTAFTTYAAPKTVNFPNNSTQIIKGTQSIVSGEKYNYWKTKPIQEISSDINNHRGFTISAGISPIISQLKPTVDGTSFQMSIIDAGTTYSDFVRFQDPWLIDYTDSYGIRNQGMSAPFKDVATGGNPLGTGTSYKGVLLNQTSPATYSVQAPTPKIINGTTSYFVNWSVSGAASVTQPTNATSPVVFTGANATVTANYKGHLLSSVQTATSSSGRKIAADNGSDLYSVYTSMGSVWFTSSLGTPDFNIGVGRNPSVAVTTGGIVHVVWENTVASYQNRVYYRRSTDGGATWGSTMEFSGYDLYGGYDAAPVVFGAHNAMIVWRYGSSGNGGLRAVYEPLGSNISFTVSSDYNSKLPAGAEQYYAPGPPLHRYGITYVTNSGQIIYNRLYVASSIALEATVTLSNANPQTGNTNPSISANPYYSTMVAAVWENSSDHKIYYRESSDGGTNWSTVKKMEHSAHTQSRPTIGINASDEICVMFQCNQYSGRAVKRYGSSAWSPAIHVAKETGPTVSSWIQNGIDEALPAMSTRGTSAPYTISATMAPPQTKSGAINSETWNGLINVTGTVTVPSTKILTIAAGTTVQFAPGTSLIANGVISAQGTAADPIEFTSMTGTTPGSWGSIWLDGTGAASSSFNYVNLKYGNEFKVNNLRSYPYFVLQNSAIENFVTGCNIYNSIGWIVTNTISNPQDHGIVVAQNSNVSCYYNTITKSGQSGIGILYTSGSNDYIFDNTIHGFGWGIGSSFGAAAWCGHPANSGDNNIITNCAIGARVYQSGYAMLGEYCEEGYPSAFIGNTIDNNSLDADVYNNSSVDAYGVDWGGGDPVFSVSGDSYFNWCEGWYKRGSESKGQSLVVADRRKGEKFRREGKHKEAARYFNSLIAKTPERIEPYIELSYSYSDSSADEVLKTFESLPKTAPPFAKLLLANIYLERNEIDKAEEINSSVSREHSKNALGDRAKLNNFYMTLYNRKDIDGAIELYNEVASKSYLTEPLDLELAKGALENYPEMDEEQRSKLKKINLVKAEVPDHYELFQNYPNPFNPSTTIDYQIPKDGMVILKIYDMLGREVKTLVNDHKSIGKYSVVFDARNLASGMYIYKLVSHPTEGGTKDTFTSVKKMVLVK